jgi:hypothetical protein
MGLKNKNHRLGEPVPRQREARVGEILCYNVLKAIGDEF